ncbi:MAG: hypothetical protein J5752_10155 [Clostridiales bacterium]|nr:hypothetical protein [Clostridiales bacterium]
MKKKIAAVLLALGLVFSVAACSKKSDSDETDKTKKTKKTTETEQTEEVEAEEVEAEELFLDCFWKQHNKGGSGFSFRFYEDGTGYFASWENEDDEENMGYKASRFEYKIKKDKMTITCEDNDELAGKYDMSFNDRGNLILEKDDTTYTLRKQEFDIEKEDFDMSQIFGYKWEYITGGEVRQCFEFFEDGTGTFTSGGGDKANAITWTVKGNRLYVTDRNDWTDEYIISLVNRDAMKLTRTTDGMSDWYIRNTLPAETTEETTTETTTVAPTTTTAEPSDTTAVPVDTTEESTEETSGKETSASEESSETADSSAETSKPGDAASGNYVNFDDMCIYVNGKKYVFGKVTLQEMIDDGVPFDESSIENAGNNVNKNSQVKFKLKFENNAYVSLYFLNDTDAGKPASECLLCELYYSNISNEKTQQDILKTDIPFDITMEELIAACGEPDENRHYQSDSDPDYYTDTFTWSKKATKYIGSSKFEYQFKKGKLDDIRIQYVP